MLDHARLAAILATLPPADAAFVMDRLAVPGYLRRAFRLDHRDAAIREAATTFASLAVTAQAQAVARAIARYLAASWLVDRVHGLPAAAPWQRALLYQIAVANEGRGLGASQIRSILRGSRATRGGQETQLEIAGAHANAARNDAVQPTQADDRDRGSTGRAA